MRRIAAPLAACSLVAAVAALYAPALKLSLVSDDYQWFQLAHRAIHQPVFLLKDLDTFWRPSSTWTLAATHLAFPFDAEAHHAVSLAVFAAAALLLLAVARKAGLGLPAAAATALIWACSPFASEPAVSVASRHETLLFAGWLGLALVWPGPGERWSRRRVAGAAACTVLAACSKETWVVTPAIAFACEVAFRRTPLRAALRPALIFAGPAVVFTALRFLLFPTFRGYFSLQPSVFAKVPHELAAFLHLEELVPLAFPFTWKGALAVAVMAGLAALGWRHAAAPTAFGLALLVAPTLPTLLVPYLPTRYTTVPYAGFLLLAAGLLEAGVRGTPSRRRPFAAAGAAALGLLVLVSGAVTVRADLIDDARLSAAHARLLRQAEAVAPAFPLDRPVLVIRAEADNPARDIMRRPHGLAKIIFVRQPDPDGLADAAALFEWVLRREGVAVRSCDDGETSLAGHPGAVLEHRPDGFVWLARNAPDIAGVARSVRLAGLRYRLIEAARLPR